MLILQAGLSGLSPAQLARKAARGWFVWLFSFVWFVWFVGQRAGLAGRGAGLFGWQNRITQDTREAQWHVSLKRVRPAACATSL